MDTLTTVYLIRHSEKIDNKLLDNSNNNEYYQTRREKIILSIEGEKKAEKLSKLKEFEDTEALMQNAPDKERGMFKIPKVLN